MSGRSEQPPAYLTDPDRAHDERDRWEAQFTSELRTWAARASTGQALTAASFPFWDLAMRTLVAVYRRLPRSFLSRLLQARPDAADDETPDEIARRIAPTLATAAYNDHVLGLFVTYGLPYKKWVTQRDLRVRPAHAEAEGQVQPLSRPFRIGGALMMYPADSRTAPIELWIHDRCCLIGIMER